MQQDDPIPPVPPLTLVERTRSVQAGQRAICQAFSETGRVLPRRLRLPGGNEERDVLWIPSLSLWAAFGTWENRHWNAFGTECPDVNRAHAPAIEINLPFSGVDRRVQGALGVGEETGATYFLHRGKIGARDGNGADLLQRRYRGRTTLMESDREEPTPVAVIGRLGAPDFLRDLAAFVHGIAHIKDSMR